MGVSRLYELTRVYEYGNEEPLSVVPHGRACAIGHEERRRGAASALPQCRGPRVIRSRVTISSISFCPTHYSCYPLPSTPFDQQMSSDLSSSLEGSRKDEETPHPGTPDLAFGELGGSEPTQTQEESVFRRTKLALARKFPGTYSVASKAFLYFRGPRPKRDLDGASFVYDIRLFRRSNRRPFLRIPEPIVPTPFLSLTWRFNNQTWSIPLEPTWIRFTRFFTHPLLFPLVVVGYIIGLSFFTRAQWYQTPSDTFTGCTGTYWLANSKCGLDGKDCLPSEYGQYDFRCPAGCDVILQNPRTVGNEKQEYVPLIVGGGDVNRTYRGDSFICSAAIQA